MKVVVFLPKEDLTERQLELIGSATFYADRVKDENDLIEKCRGSEAVLASPRRVIKLNAKFFNSLPSLKFVSIYSTGYAWVDLEAAKSAGVTVSYCPGYSTSAVAEWTISMVKKLCQPNGKTLGVIGFGRIGQVVASKAKQIGMKVLVWDQKQKSPLQVSLEKLLKESDVVSLHLSLSEETYHFIGHEKLALMKNSAFLINSSPEGLVDNGALTKALESEKLAGAAIDLDHGSKTTLPKTIMTPHVAWKNAESLQIGNEMFVQNFVKWKQGEPQNLLT